MAGVRVSTAKPGKRGALFRIVVSPVRFFEARLAEDPSWTMAATLIVAHGALASSSAAISVRKGQEALASVDVLGAGSGGALSRIGVVIGVIGAFALIWFLFALHAGVAALLDVAFSRSGRARRLVEFTAYASVPSIVWAAVSVLVLAAWWNPEPLQVPSTVLTSDLASVIADYQVRLGQAPVQIALRTVSLAFGLWLVALQAASLRVVSGFTVRGAVLSGIVMGSLLVALPWALSN